MGLLEGECVVGNAKGALLVVGGVCALYLVWMGVEAAAGGSKNAAAPAAQASAPQTPPPPQVAPTPVKEPEAPREMKLSDARAYIDAAYSPLLTCQSSFQSLPSALAEGAIAAGAVAAAVTARDLCQEAKETLSKEEIPDAAPIKFANSRAHCMFYVEQLRRVSEAVALAATGNQAAVPADITSSQTSYNIRRSQQECTADILFLEGRYPVKAIG